MEFKSIHKTVSNGKTFKKPKYIGKCLDISKGIALSFDDNESLIVVDTIEMVKDIRVSKDVMTISGISVCDRSYNYTEWVIR